MDNTANTANWRQSFRPSKRKLIQLYSALLYNAHLRGFIDGEIFQGNSKAVCVPGFNCYSCPGAVGACPLGSLQNSLAYSGHRAGWYVLGILMIFGLILGRTICGWLCPLGLIQELLHKIPTPKIRKSRVTRALSYLKYVILAIFVVAIPMWYGIRHDLAVPGFCKYICPAGTLEGAMGLLSNPKNSGYFSMLNIFFTRKFVIMLIIGTCCVFCYRSFCRFICPLGAIYGLFNKLALVSVKVDETRCNGCGACVRTCQMDVRHVGDHECINCAKCMNVCAQNALSFRAGSYTIIAPAKGCADDKPDSEIKRTRNGRTAWAIALAVLCFALVWFNLLDPSLKNHSEEVPSAGTASVGTAIGDQMADFSIQMLDGSTFHLADSRGKVTVINMWATYCGPCVKEMPIFQAFREAHPDDACVIIVHASDPLEDVTAFMERKDMTLPCAIDSNDDYVFGLCGASASVLPHTVILDRDGRIIYNQAGSMTADLLEEMYRSAE